MVIMEKLKGRGSASVGVPIVNGSSDIFYGTGNNSRIYCSHVAIGYIFESVEDGGSSNFQKFAGLWYNSCVAHFLNLLIFFYLWFIHIVSSYYLSESICSCVMGHPCDFNLKAYLSCFLKCLPLVGNVDFYWCYWLYGP